MPAYGGYLASSAVKFVPCSIWSQVAEPAVSPRQARAGVFRHLSLHNAAASHYKCVKSIHYKGVVNRLDN